MQQFYRGDTLLISTTPLDINGNPVTPSTVKLYLNYKHADGTISTDAPITMTASGNTYTAQFDTSNVLPCTLYGSVKTTVPAAAQDFTIQILANDANLDK